MDKTFITSPDTFGAFVVGADMVDEPTIADIDEALTHLRESIHAVDGDSVKRQAINDYMDELLDSRTEIAHTAVRAGQRIEVRTLEAIETR
mgnify:CR=1 FL=1